MAISARGSLPVRAPRCSIPNRIYITEQSSAAAPAMKMADERLTAMAICWGSVPPKSAKICAVRVHTGLPGG